MPTPISNPAPPHDPFAPTADPAAYVPRAATEIALLRLERALRRNAAPVSLSGPDGAGKTMLLRVLERRIEGDLRTVYVGYPKLQPAEVCAWLLAALGAPASTDPEEGLHVRITGDIERGLPPLVFMVDDAGLMPDETLRCLCALRDDTVGYLRILLVRAQDPASARFAAGGPPFQDVVLEGEMDPGEIAGYVRARLARIPVAPVLRSRLERAIAQQSRSHGNPARLHAIATQVLCRAPELRRKHEHAD